MTDINFYSRGRTRKIVAETIQCSDNDAWVRIRIMDGYDEVGTINIFGTAAITVTELENAVLA